MQKGREKGNEGGARLSEGGPCQKTFHTAKRGVALKTGGGELPFEEGGAGLGWREKLE